MLYCRDIPFWSGTLNTVGFLRDCAGTVQYLKFMNVLIMCLIIVMSASCVFIHLSVSSVMQFLCIIMILVIVMTLKT